MIWKIKHKVISEKSPDRQQEIITNLLKNRQLTNKKDQTAFFKPPAPTKIDPVKAGLKLAQLKKTKTRLNQAKKNQDLVYIYGDYDADGVSATAILWEALYDLGINVMPYIPSRKDKTRGLSKLGIDEIIKSAKTKPDLIITVDNGITAFKGAKYAKKLGIDIIITDHHQPQAKLPPVFSVVHTTKLAGAGVAWFLAYFLNPKTPNSLDVTALGTIADMVPLLSTNRSLTKFGLKKLKTSKRPGIQALANIAKVDLPNLQTYQVGYSLAPRLNAMARLDHALDSVRLLCTKDLVKANQIASLVDKTNQDRQVLTQDMVADALKQYKTMDQTKKLIFLASEKYHEGIVGLVAGRLMEKFNKPAIIVAIGENYVKASARSVAGFNVVKAFRKFDKLILELGGHELAAGFTAEAKNLPAIQKKLVKLAETELKDKKLEPQVNIECQIELADVTWELFDQLAKFKPFGMDNPDPVFSTKAARLTSFRAVGADNKHLKLKVGKLDAIAFNHGYLANQLVPNQPLNIVYTLDKNEWNNQKTLQLKIKNIQLV